MPLQDLVIKALAPARHDDFMRFFDGPAFSDNPKWSSCYCQCFYEDHSVVRWSERTAAQNRAFASQRVQAGTMRGHLAYLKGVPVGWCSAAPRHLVHALDNQPTPDAEHIGTIVCLLVDPSQRNRGIARRLLDAACEGLREQGCRSAEAYPRTAAATAAEHHFGPLSLYLSAGFAVHREDGDGSVHVRRAL